MGKPFVPSSGRVAEFLITTPECLDSIWEFRLYTDRDDLFDAAKALEGLRLTDLSDRGNGYLEFEVKPYYDHEVVLKNLNERLLAISKTDDIPF